MPLRRSWADHLDPPPCAGVAEQMNVSITWAVGLTHHDRRCLRAGALWALGVGDDSENRGIEGHTGERTGGV